MATRENTRKIQGVITEETEKAVLLKLNGGKENWFPKWTIKSHYSPDKKISQIFLIDLWILEENKIVV
jgi:hypothetical protein